MCDAHKTDDEFDKSKCDGDTENCEWQLMQRSKTATEPDALKCAMLRLDPCDRGRRQDQTTREGLCQPGDG